MSLSFKGLFSQTNTDRPKNSKLPSKKIDQVKNTATSSTLHFPVGLPLNKVL